MEGYQRRLHLVQGYYGLDLLRQKFSVAGLKELRETRLSHALRPCGSERNQQIQYDSWDRARGVIDLFLKL